MRQRSRMNIINWGPLKDVNESDKHVLLFLMAIGNDM